MKSSYIMDNYENIVREIKNFKFTVPINSDIPPERMFENFIIFPILFSKADEGRNYKIESAIHSVHPHAVDILEQNLKSDHKYNSIVPKIEQELKIQDVDREYFWLENKSFVKLFIKIYCHFPEGSTNAELITYCHNVLRHENQKIEDRIKLKVSKAKNFNDVETLIRNKHDSISNFLRFIEKKIEPSCVEDLYAISNCFDRCDCLKIVYMFAEKLLSVLEENYLKFIDPFSIPSNKYIVAREEKFNGKCAEITHIVENSKLNDDLKALLVKPVVDLVSTTVFYRQSYYDMKYKKLYCNSMHKKLIQKDADIDPVEIENLLILLNYNSLLFFKYYSDKIKNLYDDDSAHVEKLDILLHTLKTIKQQVKQGKLKYKTKLPSIKEQIVAWLKEEISYEKKKNTIQSINYTNTSDTQAKKMMSSFSVAQISYFCTLMLQAGIIDNSSRTEFFRLISQRFKTKNCENISADSLRKKSYNVEESTVQVVRERITLLLKLTES